MDDLEQPEVQDSDAAVDTAVDESTVEDDQLDSAESDADSQEQPEEEEDEIEVDGKKFAMPKSVAEKLKAERLMHADYTQKTQQVAEQRRQVEAQAQQVQRQHQEAQQYINEVAEAVNLQARLKAIDDMNLSQYVDSDPAGVVRYQEERRGLEQKLAQVGHAITQKQQQNALNEQQALAKQVQEADAYFKREIPGWSNERSNRLKDYAIEQGIPQDALFQAVVKLPAIAKALHKAELFDQLEKKQTTAKPKTPVQEKPVTRITATRTSAHRDPDKLPMDEWATKFYADQRKQRR